MRIAHKISAMSKLRTACMILLLASLISCVSPEKRKDVSEGTVPEPGQSNTYTLALKNLKDIQPGKEDSAKAETAYIIVHPSYYLFFQKKAYTIEPSDTKNIVQAFVEMNFPAENTFLNLMKIYESRENTFLSSVQSNNKLVILITPGNYRQSRTYLFKNAADEYARYLNEATKGSSSILSIESENTDTGRVSKQDMDALIHYLKLRGVQNILIGGGYVGRCLDEFYRTFSGEWREGTVAVIPDLSAFSPNDVTETTARMLLTPDQNLNVIAANYFIKNGGIKKIGRKPDLRAAADQKITPVKEQITASPENEEEDDDDSSGQ